MRTLVDLDGVVADWGAGYDQALQAYGLEEFGPYSTRLTWDLTLGMNAAQKQTHNLIMNMVGFYRELPLITHAAEGIRSLIDEGHSVFFVSTPYHSNPTCASEKYEWVERHFGQTMRRRTILTDDKTLVIGDVLIDDKPMITGNNLSPTWKHLCFGEYGYSNTTSSARVRNWTEATEAMTMESWERELTA